MPNIRMSRCRCRKSCGTSGATTGIRGGTGTRGTFRSGALVRGESTPGYSMWPVRDNVPARAARLVPQAKIIYVVRDPVERIVSHYYQRLADGFRAPLQSYIESVDLPENVLVCPSRYHTQLSRWLMWFDMSQLLVVDHEDLKVARATAVEQILEFLGLETSEQLALDAELEPLGRQVHAHGRRPDRDPDRSLAPERSPAGGDQGARAAGVSHGDVSKARSSGNARFGKPPPTRGSPATQG